MDIVSTSVLNALNTIAAKCFSVNKYGTEVVQDLEHETLTFKIYSEAPASIKVRPSDNITANCSMDSETAAIKDFFKQIIMKEA